VADEKKDDYLPWFRSIVMMGLTCGLEGPVQWAMQAHRTPGGSFLPSYYVEIEKHLPRFLSEMYEARYCAKAKTADEVLDWCNEGYEDGEFTMRGYFEFLREAIAQHLTAE